MEKIRPMLFTTLKKYSGAQLMSDVVAGIIVAIIALPLSIALALASGVGPEQGIYTAIAAGFVISFLGGSQVQIAGPTAAFATIVAGIVARSGVEGLAVATIMAGIILVIMGFCQLGSLIKFIPFTITTGFTSGIAVTIVIGQLKDFFGVTYPAGMETIETMQKLKAFAAGFRNHECSCGDRRSCLPGDPHRDAEDHGEDPGILSGSTRRYRDGEIPSVTGQHHR